MLARINSCWVHGVDGQPVTVEVNVQPGLPVFTVVGLPAAAVRESKDRVFAALAQNGHSVSGRRVTVNLAPADVHKSGSGFDLPMAVGLLAATGTVPMSAVDDIAFVGELGLDGSLRRVRGATALAMGCRARGHRSVLLPSENVAEASAVPGIEVRGACSLSELVDYLNGRGGLCPPPQPLPPIQPVEPDLREVQGQAFAKRALVVAAAGGHNLLLSGPPGAGKTMLARRLPGLLPPLSPAERLEVTRIHSVAGLLAGAHSQDVRRPFRAPHHTISTGGLVGGGSPPRPGEMSLAHLGVLFLDELPEFRRGVLETLRQPMERGTVRISRVRYALTFPARFQLVAAMNPCPCGLAGDDCVCGEIDVQRYRSRISGPLRDRIDMQVEVRALPWKDLVSQSPRGTLDSASARKQVVAARGRQRARDAGVLNADVPSSRLWRLCRLDTAALRLLEDVVDRFRLSARGVHRVMRVARTIADLDGAADVALDHLAEAVQLRTGG